MADLILIVFASIGLSHIIVESRIMMPVRDWFDRPVVPFWLRLTWWSQLLYPHIAIKDIFFWLIKSISEIMHCFQCSGFWSGMLCGAFVYTDWWRIILCGFSGSFVSMAIGILYNYLESQTVIRNPPKE